MGLESNNNVIQLNVKGPLGPSHIYKTMGERYCMTQRLKDYLKSKQVSDEDIKMALMIHEGLDRWQIVERLGKKVNNGFTYRIKRICKKLEFPYDKNEPIKAFKEHLKEIEDKKS